MTNRMRPGLNRVVRGIACTGLTLMILLTVARSAQAQGPVTPLGNGTQANPYQISQPGHLVWMGETVGSSSGKYYTLQNDIDASGTTGWNGGAGFAPIGNGDTPFMGVFDGKGKVISGLTINRPGQNYVGLFGGAGLGSVVKNLGLLGGAVTGYNSVGGLMGGSPRGTVGNCYATGPVVGHYFVGGLVGGSVGYTGGTVNWSHATGAVTGTNFVGGLVGYHNNPDTVIGCHASGAVSGNDEEAGGLVGFNGGIVSRCYATGAVTGRTLVGGLVGHNSNFSTVSVCYASGSVSGRNEVGGLVGYNVGMVRESYATDAALVTGNNYVGGLVGYNEDRAKVIGCYATDFVQASGAAGGLVGQNAGTVNSSYWDTVTSGQTGLGAGTGKTTAEMKQQATFAGWDFVTLWRITENVTYPVFPPQPGQICFDDSAYSAQEGTKKKVLVARINGSSGTVSVDYVMKPKTALAWQDYTPRNGTLTWTNGQTSSKVIKIKIVADGKAEGNEVFQVVLKNPVGASLATPFKAKITILANSKGAQDEEDATATRMASLTDALDGEGLTWFTSPLSPWTKQTFVTTDTANAAISGQTDLARVSWIQTELEGSGTLEYDWLVKGMGLDACLLMVDGKVCRTLGPGTTWTHGFITLGDGDHTVRWVFTGESRLMQGAAYLDRVSWAPEENIP